MSEPEDDNKEIEFEWKVQPRPTWADGFVRGVVLAMFMVLAALLVLGLLTLISPYR